MGHYVRTVLSEAIAISIHPSRVGWDWSYGNAVTIQHTFQSTHPVWDGTGVRRRRRPDLRNFNPPIPCGMGPR